MKCASLSAGRCVRWPAMPGEYKAAIGQVPHPTGAVAGTSRYLAWQRSPRNSEFQINSKIHAVGDIVCRIPDRRGHNWSAFYVQRARNASMV